MSTTPAPTPLDPGKGYEWLNPKSRIEQGDEALFWAQDATGPAWTPCASTIGQAPIEVGMFIRRKVKVETPAPAKKRTRKQDPAQLP